MPHQIEDCDEDEYETSYHRQRLEGEAPSLTGLWITWLPSLKLHADAVKELRGPPSHREQFRAD